jgi:hypothetical protein
MSKKEWIVVFVIYIVGSTVTGAWLHTARLRDQTRRCAEQLEQRQQRCELDRERAVNVKLRQLLQQVEARNRHPDAPSAPHVTRQDEAKR